MTVLETKRHMAPWGLSCSCELTKQHGKRSSSVLSELCILSAVDGANALTIGEKQETLPKAQKRINWAESVSTN